MTLQEDYELQKPLAEQYLSEFLHQFGSLVKGTNITLSVPVEGRVKAWSSINSKIDRNALVVKSCKDIPDFVGVRVITLFKRDVDILCRLVAKTFTILSQEDKADGLGASSFGYMSRHFSVRLPRGWRKMPGFLGHDFVTEIQVRTGAQHIWAAASHLLQYKREADVPPAVSRSIYRVAALLETVDLEFERVLDERNTYAKSKAAVAPLAPLDTDNLRIICEEKLPAANMSKAEGYSNLLEDLKTFGIQTVGELLALIESRLPAAKAKDAEVVAGFRSGTQTEYVSSDSKRIDRGVYFSHSGLVRNMLTFEFGKKFDDYLRIQSAKRRAAQKTSSSLDPD